MKLFLFLAVHSGLGLALLGILAFLTGSILLFAGKVRRRGWFVSIALCLLLFGGGLYQANDFFALGIGVPRDFSAENWAQTAPADRHFLLPSLEEQVELVGMRADEARALLGAPDYASNDTRMAYIVDSDWLDYVVLDLKIENGIITEMRTGLLS